MHASDSSGSGGGGATALPADARDYFGESLVDESSILSPGVYGRVFNPLVSAEFRRWRARPVTYTGIVLITFLAICFNFFGSRVGAGPPFGIDHPFLVEVAEQIARLRTWIIELLPATGDWRDLAGQYLGLILRPSTILPLMMAWRALVSFRDGGLYLPFRTTFLSPSEFLWGIIAVPFFASALLLVVYTGGVLGPGLVAAHNSIPPGSGRILPHPVVSIMGILFEGGMNGALICFVALYCGLVLKARPEALVPVVLAVLAIQATQCWYQNAQGKVVDLIVAKLLGLGNAPDDPFVQVYGPPARMQEIAAFIRGNSNLVFLVTSGLAKLLLCIAMWTACRVQLRRTEDELPLTPREIVRALASRWRMRRGRRRP